ncbi:MAG: glycosyltransferase [Mucilaginibacter sp.]|nr:glycosyltransferase [Mucilaginibacter sp.]
MQLLKISLITVTRNAQKTLGRCIESVIAQNYSNIEYIIIDGASTDDTLQIISQHKQHIDFFVSEPDAGIYDAMNKGIRMATGNIVGILNSDDFFAYKETLSDIATAFANDNIDVLYGNLNYINPNGSIVRKWRSGAYKPGMFNRGWMPPHPTFYCKRVLFEKWGDYKLQYGTAADYELMLRFIHLNKANTYYLNKTMITMEIGGQSNKNYFNRIKAWGNDYMAMRKNGVKFPLLSVVFKPISKIFQYI